MTKEDAIRRATSLLNAIETLPDDVDIFDGMLSWTFNDPELHIASDTTLEQDGEFVKDGSVRHWKQIGTVQVFWLTFEEEGKEMFDIGHEPSLEPPEAKVVHQCSGCDEPIYEGDSAYEIPGYGWICEQCANRFYKVVD